MLVIVGTVSVAVMCFTCNGSFDQILSSKTLSWIPKRISRHEKTTYRSGPLAARNLRHVLAAIAVNTRFGHYRGVVDGGSEKVLEFGKVGDCGGAVGCFDSRPTMGCTVVEMISSELMGTIGVI